MKLPTRPLGAPAAKAKRLDLSSALGHRAASEFIPPRVLPPRNDVLVSPVKVRNSLKTLRNRHRDNRLVRRKGRVYIINKTQKRFKARQG